jgi:hypothetical protein
MIKKNIKKEVTYDFKNASNKEFECFVNSLSCAGGEKDKSMDVRIFKSS